MSNNNFSIILSIITIFLFVCQLSLKGEADSYSKEYKEELCKHYYVSSLGNDSNKGELLYPFQSIDYGISKLKSGDTLTILGGNYRLSKEIVISLIGSKDSWIIIQGDTTNETIINANEANINWEKGYPGVRGSIQIEYSSNIRLINLTILNNHLAGINIKESDNVDVINCKIENSFASGISVWQKCSQIKILGNTIINANNREFCWGNFTGKEEPHEAISIAGAHHFEVAYNLVKDCKKEGIDIKEISAFGVVHHNYIHDCYRQGLYVDAWFGELTDIEFHNNVVTRCDIGFAVSSESGKGTKNTVTKNIKFHHNLLFNNRGVGIHFSRWGIDNPRKNISIYNNTIYHNGYGKVDTGYKYYWLCGGLYLYSTNLESIEIENNIFSENYPFEIGVSLDYNDKDFQKKKIIIQNNLIHDMNKSNYPIYMAKWTKDSVNSVTGLLPKLVNPDFVDVETEDFRTMTDSSMNKAYGAFYNISKTKYEWWKNNFPPKIEF